MSDMADNRGRTISIARFAAYVGVACGIFAIFALSWILRDVLLIAFGAIVFAAVIRALADPLHRFTRLRERWAVAIVVTVLVLGAVGLAWLFGRQIAQQL